MVDRRKLLAASLACGTHLSWIKLAQAQSTDGASMIQRLVEYSLEGAPKGNPHAMHNLAVMYYAMLGKYREPARAWMQAAAREGLPQAMYYEATSAILNWLSPDELKSNVAQLKTAALEHNHPDACAMYALRSTYPNQKWAYDSKVADECLYAAKYARVPFAHYVEFRMILSTRPHDYERQNVALRKAVNHGVLKAALDLASISAFPGDSGDKRNLSESAYWAYVSGNADFIDRHTKLLKSMGATDAMLAGARQKASMFKPETDTAWSYAADLAPWHYLVSYDKPNSLEAAKQTYIQRYYPSAEQEAMSFRKHPHFQKYQPLRAPRT